MRRQEQMRRIRSVADDHCMARSGVKLCNDARSARSHVGIAALWPISDVELCGNHDLRIDDATRRSKWQNHAFGLCAVEGARFDVQARALSDVCNVRNLRHPEGARIRETCRNGIELPAI